MKYKRAASTNDMDDMSIGVSLNCAISDTIIFNV